MTVQVALSCRRYHRLVMLRCSPGLSSRGSLEARTLRNNYDLLTQRFKHLRG
jgi:hypothetical protein